MSHGRKPARRQRPKSQYGRKVGISQDQRTLNARRSIRASSRKHLPRLMQQQGNRCHWCDELMVMLSELRHLGPAKDYPEPGFVTVQDGGQWFTFLYATVDHLREVARGGGCKIEELVASCRPCNELRGQVFHKRVKAIARRNCRQNPQKRRVSSEP